jgi:hypothetical protein
VVCTHNGFPKQVQATAQSFPVAIFTGICKSILNISVQIIKVYSSPDLLLDENIKSTSDFNIYPFITHIYTWSNDLTFLLLKYSNLPTTETLSAARSEVFNLI